jgi:hypothetical protein
MTQVIMGSQCCNKLQKKVGKFHDDILKFSDLNSEVQCRFCTEADGRS